MKKRKRGFTLIELLAVIVILMIVMLVVTPNVIRVIKKSSKKSYEASILSYADVVEQSIYNWKMKNKMKKIPTKLSEFDTSNYEGKEVICGDNFEISDDGKLYLYECYTEDSKEEGYVYNYLDGKLEYAKPTFRIENDNIYPWVQLGKGYKSNIKSLQNTSTNLTYVFTLNSDSVVEFERSASSESCCDYIYYTIYKDDVYQSNTGTSNRIGGTGYGNNDNSMSYVSTKLELTSGNYKIVFTYRKDGSVDTGTDTGYIRNFDIKYKKE